MAEIPSLFMRWLHISSAAALVGGLIYARLAIVASAQTLAPDARQALAEKAAALFRPLALTAMAALVFSGVYNVLSSPGHTLKYHILLTIKLLLAAHVFSAAILVARPAHPRRARLTLGAAISGLIVIAISAYLRRNY